MWKQIAKATLVAGVLDLSAACVQSYVVNKTTPDVILKYIASGLIGQDAFTGGAGVMRIGLIVHFFIAFSCASTFYLLYDKLPFLHRSVLVNSILIGIIAWLVTTQLIVPLSQIGPRPFVLSKVLVAITILIFCIGFPIAYFRKQYASSTRRQ